MKNVKIIANHLQEDHAKKLKTLALSFGNDVQVEMTTPTWPELKFGDTFMFGEIEFMFIKYIGSNDKQAKCIQVQNLKNDDILNPTVFTTWLTNKYDFGDLS